MRIGLVLLFFVVLVGTLFNFRGPLLNRDLLFNEIVSRESTTKLWSEIRRLHKILPIDEVIKINLNSNGGAVQETVILLERINELKQQGRQFSGLVYGVCYSACGSLFAIMNWRYMTRNSIYLQHQASHPNPSATNTYLGKLLDMYRLKYDAEMINFKYSAMVKKMQTSDLIMTAGVMEYGLMIHGIVPQPDIEEI